MKAQHLYFLHIDTFFLVLNLSQGSKLVMIRLLAFWINLRYPNILAWFTMIKELTHLNNVYRYTITYPGVSGVGSCMGIGVGDLLPKYLLHGSVSILECLF